jgi:hypothetical protein
MRDRVISRALAAGATSDQASNFADKVLDGIARVQLPLVEELDANDLQLISATALSTRTKTDEVDAPSADLREYFVPRIHPRV